MKNWYEGKTGNGQGLVIEEETGRNVAVTYDKKDAPLVAAAPELLERVEYALAVARVERQQLLEDGHQAESMTISGIEIEILSYEAAISKAKGGA